MQLSVNDIAFLRPDLEGGRKRLTNRPSRFSGQKGKQTFYFLGLIIFGLFSKNQQTFAQIMLLYFLLFTSNKNTFKQNPL